MNVIIAYLETMFRTYPQTPRMREAKAELQTMMEDAYSEHIAAGMSENEAVGKVITEFGNLDEVAPALGIVAEIAPAGAGAVGAPAAGPADPAPAAHPPVALEEAQAYSEARRRSDPMLARAVALFVISPAPLIALATLGGSGAVSFDSDLGTLIGFAGMLVLVIAGVVLVVRRNQEISPFARLAGGAFARSAPVEAWARAQADAVSGKRTVRLQIAIALWVLAALPVLAVSLLPSLSAQTSDAWSGVAVAGTLAIVAAGLLVFLPSNWAADVAEQLSRGRRSRGAGDSDEDRSLVGVIAAVYWPLLTAIFLAWGFIGSAWDRAWMVWPIGAVLFGAIAGGIGAWESYRKNRR